MLYYLAFFYLVFVLFFVRFTLGLRKEDKELLSEEDFEIRESGRIIEMMPPLSIEKKAN